MIASEEDKKGRQQGRERLLEQLEDVGVRGLVAVGWRRDHPLATTLMTHTHTTHTRHAHDTQHAHDTHTTARAEDTHAHDDVGGEKGMITHIRLDCRHTSRRAAARVPSF